MVNGQTSLGRAQQMQSATRVCTKTYVFSVHSLNDISFATESSEVRLFADDTILYLSLMIDDPTVLSEALTRDFQTFRMASNIQP